MALNPKQTDHVDVAEGSFVVICFYHTGHFYPIIKHFDNQGKICFEITSEKEKIQHSLLLPLFSTFPNDQILISK